MQVDTNAMVLGIAVEEHAELEKRVGRVFDTMDHAAWREGSLLYIPVEVLRVLIEH